MGTPRTQPPRGATDQLPEDGLATGQQPNQVTRITIGIIPKVWPELEHLIEVTNFNRADVVNRAISIYALVTDYLNEGNQLVFRDPRTKKEEIIKIV
ncbi:hypothetical protein [Trebonia sp.]|uniref:hypothetical protein n=1 Tax=Trebonia sp. TaxID=2767075 RepID=UPI002617DF7F|nr:hypothetical protein [Trebonia sp.]